MLVAINTLVLLHYIYEAIKREKIINNNLEYRKKVKKIIKQYGSIITHVRKADIGEFREIKVASFDDLLSVNTCYVYSIEKDYKEDKDYIEYTDEIDEIDHKEGSVRK